MKEAHAQKLIYRLEIETEQEKDRSDNFFESIKHIEQDTNKFRNAYIKECNEKDELKGGYSKLDEQYKNQAIEIAKLKHKCLENEKKLDYMNNSESEEEKTEK